MCSFLCCTYWWRLQWWWWRRRRRRRRHNVFDKNHRIFCTLLILCIHCNATDDHIWIACCAIVLVCSWLRFVLHTRDYFGLLFTLYFNLCCIHMTAIQRDCKAVGIRIAISVRCFFYACERASICAQCAYIYWWILFGAFSLTLPASLSLSISLRLSISHEEQKCCWYDMNALAPAKPFITYCT